MAGNAEGSAPEVKESEYVSTTDGPEDDTDIFYKRTPAPGVREVCIDTALPEAPRERRSDEDRPRWLKRSSSAVEMNATEAGAEEAKPNALLWIGAAVGFLLLIVVITLIAVSLKGPAPGPEVVPNDVTDFEGVRVKKGLR